MVVCYSALHTLYVPVTIDKMYNVPSFVKVVTMTMSIFLFFCSSYFLIYFVCNSLRSNLSCCYLLFGASMVIDIRCSEFIITSHCFDGLHHVVSSHFSSLHILTAQIGSDGSTDSIRCDHVFLMADSWSFYDHMRIGYYHSLRRGK